jgi:hypothetical protein
MPIKSKTVFFDCRDCGWSTGANNERWAVDIILANIRNHLLYDSRHLGLPNIQVSAEQKARDLLERMEIEGAHSSRIPLQPPKFDIPEDEREYLVNRPGLVLWTRKPKEDKE